MLNRVQVIGRLGADPEMKYTANGKAVTNFSVAADSGSRDNKRTEWFRVVTWEATAEACAQYLGKGSLVYIEGRQETRSWDGQDGKKQYRTELVAERVQFLDRREDREPIDSTPDLDPDNLPF